jgi:hypothetical protein
VGGWMGWVRGRREREEISGFQILGRLQLISSIGRINKILLLYIFKKLLIDTRIKGTIIIF